MQWVVIILAGAIWQVAYSDWGWNGWIAFAFACVCIGIIGGLWQSIFGKSFLDDGSSGNAPAEEKKGSSLTETALKMGAGYGLAKLTGEKTYGYQCKNCNHYEERSQEKIGAKCPRCGKGWMKVKKV